MRDRYGHSGRNLVLELGDDASPASEDVSEADCHIGRLRMLLPDVVQNHLCDALGRPHHAGRIDRLVRRDEKHFFHAVASRQPRDVQRSSGVDAHRFPRVHLHQRDVLVRRGVKHQSRRVQPEYGVHRDGIRHIGYDRPVRDTDMFARKRFDQGVDRLFPMSEQDEFLRRILRRLTGDFRTDRSTGARHEDGPSSDDAGDPLEVEAHGFASQQVFEPDLSEAADGDFSSGDLAQARKHADFHARRNDRVEYLSDARSAR